MCSNQSPGRSPPRLSDARNDWNRAGCSSRWLAAAKNSAWVREWAAAAPTPTTRKGELLTSLKTIDIDVCTSSVIEMKSRFEDNGSRATFFERREIRPLTP